MLNPMPSPTASKTPPGPRNASVAAVTAAAARKARRAQLLVWGVVAIVGIVLATVIIMATAGGSSPTATPSASPSSPSPTATSSSAAGIEGVVVTTGWSRDHAEGQPEPSPVNGVLLPPAGGTHSAQWQSCAVYDEPIDTWRAVHSMEHGAVWITYNPALDASEVASLAALADGQDYVLMSPLPDLTSPVVLTAWGLQLELPSADDPRAAQFVAAYANGPQTPEPGAPCVGGVDSH